MAHVLLTAESSSSEGSYNRIHEPSDITPTGSVMAGSCSFLVWKICIKATSLLD
ncbi:MAG: hypothetical protein LUQ36_04405 [Methanoregula sp.]|nr:hypothetical protein [Methanoregula sp.]